LSLTEKEISESEISSWLHQVSITFLDSIRSHKLL
jgi:hypothetical protein